MDGGALKVHSTDCCCVAVPVAAPASSAPPVAHESRLSIAAVPDGTHPVVGAGVPSGARHVDVVYTSSACAGAAATNTAAQTKRSERRCIAKNRSPAQARSSHHQRASAADGHAHRSGLPARVRVASLPLDPRNEAEASSLLHSSKTVLEPKPAVGIGAHRLDRNARARSGSKGVQDDGCVFSSWAADQSPGERHALAVADTSRTHAQCDLRTHLQPHGSGRGESFVE